MTELSTLLERVKDGQTLARDEIESLRQTLNRGSSRDDLYTALHIIGQSHDYDSEALVERYLGRKPQEDEESDDQAEMLRRLAVQILGRMWSKRAYFDRISRMAFADPSPYVRLAAASAIGAFGNDHADLKPEAARLALSGLSSEKETERDVKGVFYTAMLELLDVPVTQWPVIDETFDPDTDVDTGVIDRVRHIAAAAD